MLDAVEASEVVAQLAGPEPNCECRGLFFWVAMRLFRREDRRTRLSLKTLQKIYPLLESGLKPSLTSFMETLLAVKQYKKAAAGRSMLEVFWSAL